MKENKSLTEAQAFELIGKITMLVTKPHNPEKAEEKG
jgi:hypothetical protein